MTPKQERFVAEYVKDLNATQAAIRAKYARGSADVTGARLLGNARVRAAVDEKLQRVAERAELSVQWVLDRLRENAMSALAAEDRSAANRSLELIGKHLAMFTDKVEQSGTIKHEHYTPEVPLSLTERQGRLVALLAEARN